MGIKEAFANMSDEFKEKAAKCASYAAHKGLYHKKNCLKRSRDI